jgi:hypothetical protein
MTAMTQQQEAVLRELILLAQGDSDLVWEAIRVNARDEGTAPLEAVVRFIAQRIREQRNEARHAATHLATC